MIKKIKRDTLWLYGKHSCISAIKNENRKCYELAVEKNSISRYQNVLKLTEQLDIGYKLVKSNFFDSVLPINSNHQGIALKVSPITNKISLEETISKANNKEFSTLVLLDQVTDVHNVGSIIRSAVCFNADAVILTYNNSPSENCIMTKTSSGATELIPIIRVTNLVNTMKYLQKLGYWAYGFDVKGTTYVNKIKFSSKTIIVLGSEKKGLRQLTKSYCDHLVKIPISYQMESLNVSNAATVALYSVYISQMS